LDTSIVVDEARYEVVWFLYPYNSIGEGGFKHIDVNLRRFIRSRPTLEELLFSFSKKEQE